MNIQLCKILEGHRRRSVSLSTCKKENALVGTAGSLTFSVGQVAPPEYIYYSKQREMNRGLTRSPTPFARYVVLVHDFFLAG